MQIIDEQVAKRLKIPLKALLKRRIKAGYRVACAERTSDGSIIYKLIMPTTY